MSTQEVVPNQLILYINIPSNGVILMDIFPESSSSSDVLKIISKRLNQSFPGCGLFLASRINKRRARFLLPSKTLDYYRLKSWVCTVTSTKLKKFLVLIFHT